MRRRVGKKLKRVIATALAIGLCMSTGSEQLLAASIYDAETAAEITAEETLEAGAEGVEAEAEGADAATEDVETAAGSSEAAAPELVSAVYETENFKVISTMTDRWEEGFNATIVVENLSDAEIRNWYLQFPMETEVTNFWNAEVVKREEGNYLLKNAGWNADIPAGGCVEIGYSVNVPFVAFPESYQLLGSVVKNTEDLYEVEYQVEEDWGEGFKGAITIRNKSDQLLEDWFLEFDFANEFTSIWNAEVTAHEGSHYVIYNAGYNRNIAAGENVVIGFIVSDGDSAELLSNISCSSFTLEAQEEETEEEEEEEEEEELFENYIKEPEDGDILLDDESGVYYVKNQLMVGTYFGTPKDLMEQLADEIGADVVGYIELMDLFQFEFRADVRFEELRALIDYLEGFPFVEYADVVYATPCDMNYFSNDALYDSAEPLWQSYWSDANGNNKCEDSERYNVLTSGMNDGWKKFLVSGNNWGLEAIKVHNAWELRDKFQEEAVKVGIYDNMFGTNEDLSFAKIENNPKTIDKMHGTHVAGTIGAKFDNGIGISGVATNVELYGYSVEKTSLGFSSVMAKLIAYDVRVINVSYGFTDNIVVAASHNVKNARDLVINEASTLAKGLKKLILRGYDFLIVNSAGNGNDKEYVRDQKNFTYEYELYDSTNPAHASLTPFVDHPDAVYNYHLTYITDSLVKDRIIVVGAAKNDGSQKFSVADFSNRGSRVDVYAPGVSILSTIPKGIIAEQYVCMQGTSMAAPHITGLAALMLQANPTLRAADIKKIIMENHGFEVTGLGSTKYMPDAEACVTIALETVGGNGSHDDPIPSGTLKGKVVISDGTALEGAEITIVRTSTGEANIRDYCFTTTTKADGTYEIDLPQGTYEMVVSGETFNGNVMPYRTDNIVIKPDEITYLETSVVYMTNAQELSLTHCKVSGAVCDAINGRAIQGATIKARAGWNVYNGKYATDIVGNVRSATSDASGYFDLDLNIGQYTVEIEKDGYVVGYFNMMARRYMDNARTTVVLSPILADDEYRIVLTWGAEPKDLDAHMTSYEGGSKKLHVFFNSRTGYFDGTSTIALDFDDTYSYGPETITIKGVIPDDVKFIYSVHDFSDGNNSSSLMLANSQALVRVYHGSEPVQTFSVPAGTPGTVWQVFELTKNGLKAKNTIYSAYAGDVR